MTLYSIKEIEKLTGIKAHTIRIWEQRYNIIKPFRTETQIRYYDDSHLKKLLNISSLLSNGFRISKISNLSDEQLHYYLNQITADKTSSKEDIFVNQLIEAGLGFNELQFEKVFSTCVLRLGLENTYIKIIYPLLNKIGLMWCQDQLNPAQEHFVSQLIKQKLFSAIDALIPAENSKYCFLLFLPEKEGHDIGLLMANYVLRISGVKTIYLGPYVPLENLKMTVEACKPTHLLTFLRESKLKSSQQAYINQLSEHFKKIKLVFAISRTNEFIMPKNGACVNSIEQLKNIIV